MQNLYLPVYAFSKSVPPCTDYDFGSPTFKPSRYRYPIATTPDDGRGLFSDIKTHPEEESLYSEFRGETSYGGTGASRWFKLYSNVDPGMPGIGSLTSCVFSFHMKARGPGRTLKISTESSGPGNDPSNTLYYAAVSFEEHCYSSILAYRSPGAPAYGKTWADRGTPQYWTGDIGFNFLDTASLPTSLSGIPEIPLKYTAALNMTVFSGYPGAWIKATVELE